MNILTDQDAKGILQRSSRSGWMSYATFKLIKYWATHTHAMLEGKCPECGNQVSSRPEYKFEACGNCQKLYRVSLSMGSPS